MDLLDRLLEHDTWTTHQLLDLSRSLSGEQLDQQFELGHQTVRRTFEHIIHNMEVWSALMAGIAPGSSNVDQDSIEQFTLRLDLASKRLSDISKTIRDRAGWDERWVDSIDGKEKSYGGAIAHILTHSMHHRAQLLYMLRRLGVENLPEGDVLSWEHQPR